MQQRVIGSKAEARQMMTAVQGFLAERLNLSVSAEKSGITAASKGAPFLGYHVCAFTLRSPGTMTRRAQWVAVGRCASDDAPREGT
jgi:hypothetical protein